jgi:hypothetical protein
MGLPRAAVNLLIHQAASEGWSGRAVTLGRQHVYLTAAECLQLAQLAGWPVQPGFQATLHRDPLLRQRGYISDDSLFELLGFGQLTRVDQSDYEQAEERLDLNCHQTPSHLVGAFDVVVDSGTVEHIFEIGQALRHCLNMAKVGGQIVHLTPSSNAINHGFYSVSPSLYLDFYRDCGCQVQKLWLCRLPKSDLLRGSWKVYDCMSDPRSWLPLGRLDGAIWMTYAVITKTDPCDPNRVPQQTFYTQTWADKGPSHSAQSAQEPQRESQTACRPSLEKPSVESLAGGHGAASGSRAERWLNRLSRWPKIQVCCRKAVELYRGRINAWREWRRGRVPYKFVGRF